MALSFFNSLCNAAFPHRCPCLSQCNVSSQTVWKHGSYSMTSVPPTPPDLTHVDLSLLKDVLIH